ncbi:MAG: hypothetical protein NC320_10575 [Clostridium sp.]|nr:hypothetical protein [Clostridium sp.]MCM1547975.1 hypothetical protein [Ruminococcus sp.]
MDNNEPNIISEAEMQTDDNRYDRAVKIVMIILVIAVSAYLIIHICMFIFSKQSDTRRSDLDEQEISRIEVISGLSLVESEYVYAADWSSDKDYDLEIWVEGIQNRLEFISRCEALENASAETSYFYMSADAECQFYKSDDADTWKAYVRIYDPKGDAGLKSIFCRQGEK